MQAFDDEIIKNGLTEEERWQVIYYIQTFAPEFSKPSCIHIKDYKALIKKGLYSKESIAKGKEVLKRQSAGSAMGRAERRWCKRGEEG